MWSASSGFLAKNRLNAACQSDSGINIEALVGFGCDPNVLDSLGSTILHQVH